MQERLVCCRKFVKRRRTLALRIASTEELSHEKPRHCLSFRSLNGTFEIWNENAVGHVPCLARGGSVYV